MEVKSLPVVSFIIVNYNTTELTRNCIESVLKFTSIPFEMILIDNCSPDRTIEQLQAAYPELRIVYNKENIGFGRANNQGIMMAKAAYLFLLNSDALLTSDAAKSFLSYLEHPNNRCVACCGGSLVTSEGKQRISYGNFPSLAEIFAVLGPRILYKNYYRKRLSSGVKVWQDQPHVVDYVSGADWFIRKAILDEVGLFDEDFFLYFEETELAFRIRKKGYLSVILPAVKIIHLENGSQALVPNLNKQKFFAKHRLLFFQKSHGPFSAMVAKTLYFLQGLLLKLLHRAK